MFILSIYQTKFILPWPRFKKIFELKVHVSWKKHDQQTSRHTLCASCDSISLSSKIEAIQHGIDRTIRCASPYSPGYLAFDRKIHNNKNSSGGYVWGSVLKLKPKFPEFPVTGFRRNDVTRWRLNFSRNKNYFGQTNQLILINLVSFER